MSKSRKQALDPIFVAIDRHRSAFKHESKCCIALSNLRDRIMKRADQRRTHYEERVTNDEPALRVTSTPVLIRGFPHIKPHVADVFGRLESLVGPKTAKRVHRLRGTAERELNARMREMYARHHAQRKALGLRAAEDKLDEASARVDRAFAKLVKCAPQTRVGAVALTNYLHELLEGEVVEPRTMLPLLKALRDWTLLPS